jgi:hypothetical protein
MLGLALMVGGMLALGAFTAPVVFGQFPREEAGPAMALIFRRYDIVLLVALALVLLGERIRLASKAVPTRSRLAIVRYVLLALLTAGVLFSSLMVNPDIERMNRAGWHRGHATARESRFEATHKLSENLYKADLLLEVLLILLTPFAGHGTDPSKTRRVAADG